MKTAEEYLNSKGFYNTNRLNNCFGEEITITDMLRDYATEAIKADRERVAENAKIKPYIYPDGYVSHDQTEIDKQSILNLPIELK